jgi:eukaryotic-like serine/threonine-protein kinase
MIEALTEKAEEIFYSALEIKSPDERVEFLDRACLKNAELRAAVDELLVSQSKAEKFFAGGGIQQVSVADLAKTLEEMPDFAGKSEPVPLPDEELGKTVGPYKLLQRLGEGGCGVVYMAEQERPVRRRVAFKIIKLGMDTKNVIARFEAERQALALMDHPNIARVLDAGTTQTGRPYFVMELVRGVKITDYCDQNELDTRQRLELFMQVCRAIQHAHQKGVIHRDIKPSNILVTVIDGVAIPKVIDFGIAKAIEGRLTDNTIFTAYEQFIGTPAYMSPEQSFMSGVDVDTRSDIYSLGVLLYELLTGRTPFETKELLKNGMDGLRRTLQEREPQRPSVILTTLQGSALALMARQRHAEPLKLISLLRGDLDWIVIRTLEKDRARRYETANGLALDVQRFLENEPVTARPPSRLYLLQKLVRRNKVACVAGVIVSLALIVGFGLSTWFWYEEREARKFAVAAEKQALAAEQQQAHLRQAAEENERITLAAFLASQNKLEEADDLVGRIATIKPSLDAEAVFRALGQWHALKGQWTDAADRFNMVLTADQRDNAWAITEDLLKAGPILIERGDTQGYEKFRRAAIARYHDTTNPILAERTLKISLLRAADPDVMKSLEILSNVSAKSMESAGQDTIMEAWRCVSLGLMAYREGNMPACKMWCEKCLSYPDNNPSRISTAHIIKSMACYRLGEKDNALAEMMAGRDMITTEFDNGLGEGNGLEGFWYDWLFARILLREAEMLIEGPASAID